MYVNYCSRTVERLPRISRGLVDIECRENDSISFECKLNITQETDIRWQKDGKVCILNLNSFVHGTRFERFNIHKHFI